MYHMWETDNLNYRQNSNGRRTANVFHVYVLVQVIQPEYQWGEGEFINLITLAL